MCKTFEVKEGVLSLHFDCVFRGDSNKVEQKRMDYLRAILEGGAVVKGRN